MRMNITVRKYNILLDLFARVGRSVADPHRKNADADADPGKNLNAKADPDAVPDADVDPDADADSCPYCTMASQVLV